MSQTRSEYISIDEARDSFEELIDRIVETGNPVTIERGGEPQVIMVAARERERTADAGVSTEAGEDWEVLADRARELVLQDLAGQHFPDVIELIRVAREERDVQLLANVVDPLR